MNSSTFSSLPGLFGGREAWRGLDSILFLTVDVVVSEALTLSSRCGHVLLPTAVGLGSQRPEAVLLP